MVELLECGNYCRLVHFIAKTAGSISRLATKELPGVGAVLTECLLQGSCIWASAAPSRLFQSDTVTLSVTLTVLIICTSFVINMYKRGTCAER